MSAQTDLGSRIAVATSISTFEGIAEDLANGEGTPDLIEALRLRLLDLDLHLPQRLREYAERIMNAGDPIYEEVMKVLFLARSLDTLASLKINGAEENLRLLGRTLARDGRYGAYRASVFGTKPLAWWNRNGS
jgi:hypothetical protein